MAATARLPDSVVLARQPQVRSCRALASSLTVADVVQGSALEPIVTNVVSSLAVGPILADAGRGLFIELSVTD